MWTILSCQPPNFIKKTYGAPPGPVSHHGDAPGAVVGDGVRHACAAPCSQRRRRRFYAFGAARVAAVPWRWLHGGASVFGLGGSLRIGEDQDRNEEGNSDILDIASSINPWRDFSSFVFDFGGRWWGGKCKCAFCSRYVWLLVVSDYVTPLLLLLLPSSSSFFFLLLLLLLLWWWWSSWSCRSHFLALHAVLKWRPPWLATCKAGFPNNRITDIFRFLIFR